MAASGTAVTVLTPNGRRQTVKVSPNTPLLQVLEDVCKKHGFSSEDHGLKFQRTVLDLTLQWRFANLPNNAKLEMVPSTKKVAAADTQVRIALQMEDGSRLQDSFSSGQSLWDLLTHFPQICVLQLSETGAIPVCVYMRDEVVGEEALKNATLKSLGLTGGSAIVRFLIKGNKTNEELNGDKIAEPAVMTHAPVEVDKTPCRAPQTDTDPQQPQMVTPDVPTSVKNRPEEILSTANTDDATSQTSSISEQQDKNVNSQDAVRPKEPLVQTPELPCCSSSTTTNALSTPFIPFSGGGQRLGSPTGAASVRPSLVGQGSVVESPKAKKPKSSHNLTNKPTVCHKEDLDEAEQFLEPVEREALVYHMDSQLYHSNDTDLPDEFFEVTVDDIRKRFAHLKSERKLLEEAPLMTKALREAQIREKMQRYPKVVLRIQFPDRHVLQGFFRPMETVGALRQFVRNHLEDSQLSFYLFITPPKTILKDPSVTLYQADLFPGALVYFGSDVKTDTYLKTELLDTSVSALQANESIASFLPSQTSSSSTLDQEEPVSSPEQNMDTSEPSQEERPARVRPPNPGLIQGRSPNGSNSQVRNEDARALAQGLDLSGFFMDPQTGPYLNKRALCSPLGAARVCQLALGCAVIALIAHGAGYSGSHGEFCMAAWCFCFSMTVVIFFLDATRLHSCFPISWDNFTVTCAPCYTHVCNSICGLPAVLLSYGTEVALCRAKPGQTVVGYMATVSGLLKVVQGFVACIIFGALANKSEYSRYEATIYCVVVYAFCFTLTAVVVLMTVCGRTRAVLCMPFERFVVVCTLLEVLLYLSASVVWPVFCFEAKYGSPERPYHCPRGKCPWDSKLVVAVFSFVNLILYAADLLYSQTMRFVSPRFPTAPRV
ncbi:hypothetical protein WMY93_006629 [Mugilogobius chulae]|uniref:UBX domain-containing protein n=1 Tax=Mugilogobius chulae TaxID=88201 RepID=A0AAW0PVZ9_9GOBI